MSMFMFTLMLLGLAILIPVLIGMAIVTWGSDKPGPPPPGAFILTHKGDTPIPEDEQGDPFRELHGYLNVALVCPHCQQKGKVRTKTVKQKKGISGGKAMAGLVTGGVSLLATGLSRKETLTQAHCGNCSSTWHF